MQEEAAVFLEMRARNGLPPWTFRVEGRGPKDDILAVERAVALTDRHRRLSGVVPHRGEAITLRIEAGDSRARTLRSVRIDKREIGLQKLAVLDHVLLARSLRHDRLSVRREERLHHIPIARKFSEQLLTGSRRICRLVLIVGLLRNQRRGEEQGQCDPFRHGTG